MEVTVRRVMPDEMDLLCEFDQNIFGNDGFDTPDLWEGLEIYFILLNQEIVGSLAFRHHSDVSEGYEAEYPYLHNSLYLVSIGILPEKQARGIGSMAMTWLIDYVNKYAHSQRAGDGFRRIVSNARKSNLPSLRLHQKFCFEIIRTIPGYYEDPNEDATVFELKL